MALLFLAEKKVCQEKDFNKKRKGKMAEDTVSCGAYARRAKMASKEEKEVEKSLLMAHWQLQCTQERYRRSGTRISRYFKRPGDPK